MMNSTEYDQDSRTNKVNQKTKLTFAFVCLDAHGHINSLMGLADQLRDTGHRTIFICSKTDIPEKRGHEMFHMAKKVSDEEQRVLDGEASIFTPKEFNDNLAERVCKYSLNVNKREQLLESLINNHNVTVDFCKTEMIPIDDDVEETLIKIKPDICILDMCSTFSCVYKLATDKEYAKKVGFKKQMRWCTFNSCNPMLLYHAYGKGKFPPPLMNLPVGKMSDEEIWKEHKNFEECLKASLKPALRRQLAAKLGIADKVTEEEILYGKFGLNLSDWYNIYTFPRILDYKGEHGITLPADEWLQIDSSIRKPLPDSCGSKDKDFFRQVENWRQREDIKVIYISLGTTISLYVDVLDQVLQQAFNCLKKHPNWNIIMSLGVRSSKLPESSLSEAKSWENQNRMISRNWMPQPELLSRRLVDVVVTHGGNNTICEIFQYQVPHVVVVSGFYDQLDNARRVSDLNLGVGLGVTEFVDPNVSKDLLNDSIESSLAINKIREESKKYEEVRDARFGAETIVNKLLAEMHLKL